MLDEPTKRLEPMIPPSVIIVMCRGRSFFGLCATVVFAALTMLFGSFQT